MPQQEFVSESHPRHPTAYLGRMRREQEDLVLAGDNPKGMRTTILRPPDFYGPDSELSYVRAIFDATLKGGTANVIGPIVQDPDSSQRGNSLNSVRHRQKPRLRIAGKFMLRLLGWFNPFLREVVEMHYLWTNPVKLDDTCLRQLLPNLHKTSYAEGIRVTIESMRD